MSFCSHMIERILPMVLYFKKKKLHHLLDRFQDHKYSFTVSFYVFQYYIPDDQKGFTFSFKKRMTIGRKKIPSNERPQI